MRAVWDMLLPSLKELALDSLASGGATGCIAALPYRSSWAPPAGPCSCKNLPFTAASSAST